MVSKQSVTLQRWGAIFSFIIYDIVLVYISGHLSVRPNSNLIIRYTFQWVDQFQLSPLAILGLFILPFVISYIFAVGSISGQMVQVIGPDSLMKRIQIEFHSGSPERKDFTLENVEYLLENMARGEPEGTFKNLKMLFNVGLLVSNLIEKSGVKSVKRVYISDDLTPNAFTLRIIPLPFIGQDWIIINRNVVDILNQDEIEAVVAHEIGHAARKDSWINSVLYSPRLVIIFAWSILLGAMASVILSDPFSLDSFLRIITLLVTFGLVRLFMNAGHKLTTYAYRQTELLADYYAANLVGSETLVNALIKIGSRGEVIRSINTELEWLNKQFETMDLDAMSMRVLHFFDPSEISKNVAREYSIEFFVRAKLNQIFRGFRLQITDEEFNNYVNQATENVKKMRGMQIESEEAPNVLGTERRNKYTSDWSLADLDQNKYLDREEIKHLVTTLRREDKTIFETEALEKLGVLPQVKTHPQVSQRIFFLYDNLMKE